MTTPSPKQPSEAYQEALLERFGNPDDLARELTGHTPPAEPAERLRQAASRAPVPPRTPAGAGRYADEHTRILRWIKRSHPDWHGELCVIGEGGVAHVITARGSTTGYSLCGKRGPAMTASDTLPPCRVCTQ